MATSASPKKLKCEWLVIIPDHEGALAKRMEIRPKHLENAKKNQSAGFWLFGGATLRDQPVEGQALDPNGSAMLAIADSKEEVMEMLQKDVYVEAGVWDLSKVQIFPFRSALRTGME